MFGSLTPDCVLDLVEAALGQRCNGICRSRASYINRVYEVGLNDGSFVIAKFYRPGRWSREALQDELEFVAELAADELPVVPPLPGCDGERLRMAGDTPFALFPRVGGRPLEEPAPEAAFAGLALPAQPGEQAMLAAGGRVIYLHLPHGYGRTKLNNGYFERRLGAAATTRNWRTVLALVEMSAR